jgi:pimeloyl-ACP methyl ester carboxylesterase
MHRVKITDAHTRVIVRSGRGRWYQRILLRLLAAFAGLVAAGAGYQLIAEIADQRAFPPPGQLVRVGEHQLHIYCNGHGSPTIVLNHVGAGNVKQWALIQPQLATTTRVCAYDRAGFGWSDPATGSRDARTSAYELHALLIEAGERGPFLLVGHSYGGRVAKLFAENYPSEVLGIILIDPGTIFNHPSVPPDINAAWQEESATIITVAPALARLGLMRLSNLFEGDGGTGDLGSGDKAAFYAHTSTGQFWDAVAAEAEALPTSSAQELAITSLGDIPLLVLSAELPASSSRTAWTTLNSTIANLSSRGQHQVVDGAEHMSFAWKQQYSDVVVGAVRTMLANNHGPTSVR